MSIALEKTLSILLLIILGFFLRSKLMKEEHKKGLKVIILDLALPAMIFVALLGIKMDSDLLLLPVLTLAWNVLMYGASYLFLPWMGVQQNSSQHRTWMLLFPSLAPGLSCFPFIMEYLGEEALAWAALADVGNKIFVLVFSYMLAMSWYYRVQQMGNRSSKEKVKSLLLAMLKEPINMVILAAILFLSIGWNMDTLPGFIKSPVLMLKEIMTPLILLFIGVSVILKWDVIRKIISLLMFRAGLTLLISGLVISIFQFSSNTAILFAIVFPLSSASFWPFAHMAGVSQLEATANSESRKKTFDMDLAINILAVSLPFSTILILGIFTAGDYFLAPVNVLGLGGILVLLPLIPKVFSLVKGIDFDFGTDKSPSLKNSASK